MRASNLPPGGSRERGLCRIRNSLTQGENVATAEVLIGLLQQLTRDALARSDRDGKLGKQVASMYAAMCKSSVERGLGLSCLETGVEQAGLCGERAIRAVGQRMAVSRTLWTARRWTRSARQGGGGRQDRPNTHSFARLASLLLTKGGTDRHGCTRERRRGEGWTWLAHWRVTLPISPTSWQGMGPGAEHFEGLLVRSVLPQRECRDEMTRMPRYLRHVTRVAERVRVEMGQVPTASWVDDDSGGDPKQVLPQAGSIGSAKDARAAYRTAPQSRQGRDRRFPNHIYHGIEYPALAVGSNQSCGR